jgi:hypothetical protein
LTRLPGFGDQFSNYLLKKLISNNSIQIFEIDQEMDPVSLFPLEISSSFGVKSKNSNSMEFKLKINQELERMDKQFPKMKGIHKNDIFFHFDKGIVNSKGNPIGPYKLNSIMNESPLKLMLKESEGKNLIVEGSVIRNDSNFIYHLRFTNKFQTEIKTLQFKFHEKSIFGKSTSNQFNVSIPKNGVHECYIPLVLDLSVEFDKNILIAMRVLPQYSVVYFNSFIEPELFFFNQIPSTFYSKQQEKPQILFDDFF